MLCWPFGDHCHVCYVIMALGDLSGVWLCYVGPLVTLAVLGYIM